MAASQLASASWCSFQVVEGFRQIAVRVGDARVDGDRSADQLDGGLRMTGLRGDQSEQMQRVEVSRLALQDRPVDALRLGQLALPMQGQGAGEDRLIMRWR